MEKLAAAEAAASSAQVENQRQAGQIADLVSDIRHLQWAMKAPLRANAGWIWNITSRKWTNSWRRQLKGSKSGARVGSDAWHVVSGEADHDERHEISSAGDGRGWRMC